MNFRKLSILLVAVLAAACASGRGTGQTPGSADRPPMEVHQIGAIFFGSSYSTPMSLDFVVENNTTEPMKIWRIIVQDAGMVQYGIPISSREYRRTIDPGKAEKFSMMVTAETDIPRLIPNEPLVVRVTLDGEKGGKRSRWLYLRENVYQP